ncbi:MerR family transcriptional regulator [Sphingobium sp. BYY-5]|uniref:MerR family transcriptional regulator n=1 Tax=Sphingobium sp. BYY-5 TaxID=2926400 RepID=UPI001FA746EE|nr:MerR family transcriptional regulator [Sphingobium sp. BYY-5]MCI4591479.1 MerR family transcriptional regulator [Sphingobium sp. BYY-5]
MPLPVSPFQSRFTRQQVCEAVGLDSELLTYWVKEGLLLVESGGAGRGNPRLFGFQAIHIAAVMKELMRYGVQTAGLKAVAELLWRIVDFCSQHPDITEKVRADASALRRARANYPARMSVRADEIFAGRDYDNFEDWLEAHPNISEKAFEIEPWFEEAADIAFALYHDLFTDKIFKDFHTRWIFTHADGELVAIPEDMQGESLDAEKLPSYLTVNLSRIIRPIWML